MKKHIMKYKDEDDNIGFVDVIEFDMNDRKVLKDEKHVLKYRYVRLNFNNKSYFIESSKIDKIFDKKNYDISVDENKFKNTFNILKHDMLNNSWIYIFIFLPVTNLIAYALLCFVLVTESKNFHNRAKLVMLMSSILIILGINDYTGLAPMMSIPFFLIMNIFNLLFLSLFRINDKFDINKFQRYSLRNINIEKIIEESSKEYNKIKEELFNKDKEEEYLKFFEDIPINNSKKLELDNNLLKDIDFKIKEKKKILNEV